MPRKMNQPKTILKHIFNGVDSSQDAMKLALCKQQEVNGYLKEFAEGMWDNAYVQVDYSRVTMPNWRRAALDSIKKLTEAEYEDGAQCLKNLALSSNLQ